MEIALSYAGEGRVCQLTALSSVGQAMLADL